MGKWVLQVFLDNSESRRVPYIPIQELHLKRCRKPDGYGPGTDLCERRSVVLQDFSAYFCQPDERAGGMMLENSLFTILHRVNAKGKAARVMHRQTKADRAFNNRAMGERIGPDRAGQ
jgi:hypothetical protein